MIIDYNAEVAAVYALLKQGGMTAGSMTPYRQCYEALGKHLLDTSQYFSMQVALKWLEGRKAGWKEQTYKKYRLALYRFSHYLEYGCIKRVAHCGNRFFEYHDSDSSCNKLPAEYKVIYRTFYDKVVNEHSSRLASQYKRGIKDFLYFIVDKGSLNPSDLTIDILLGYSHKLQNSSLSAGAKHRFVSATNFILSYFCEQGYTPRCYLSVVTSSKFKGDRIDNSVFRLSDDEYSGNAVQPTKKLDVKVDEFFAKLEYKHHTKGTTQSIGYFLDEFFKFLEINKLEYSSTASSLWLDNIPSNISAQSRRPIVTMFDNFMETGSIKHFKKSRWKPIRYDALPGWSCGIIDDFITLRKREGWTNKTIETSRASSVRFFGFLDQKGIVRPEEITHLLVKEFHDTQPHKTPRSRNLYSSAIRKLLIHMAEQKLVPQNLHLALSTQYAPVREIVNVMTLEMESAVFDYRKNAKLPIELRNSAMIMLGLRMGLRASDVVKLRISDFDWKNKNLSFVQSKTQKAITLPIPTDVGNSVYEYILRGRPQVGTLGDGYVFIGHKSPFADLSYAVCRKALIEVLTQYNLELPFGQGFHITRRTFATKMLTARNPIDIITDSLGHSTRNVVDSYLAHDKDGMRLCSLPFAVGGAYAI